VLQTLRAVSTYESRVCNTQVGPRDFRDYMLFHNKQLYGPAYQPAPFCQVLVLCLFYYGKMLHINLSQ
jgi:hypothetical protein